MSAIKLHDESNEASREEGDLSKLYNNSANSAVNPGLVLNNASSVALPHNKSMAIRSKISLESSQPPKKPNMKLKGIYYEKMKKRERLAKREFFLQESYKFGKKNASDAQFESPKHQSSEKKNLKKMESRYQAINKRDSPLSRLTQSSQLKIAQALSDHLSEQFQKFSGKREKE